MPQSVNMGNVISTAASLLPPAQNTRSFTEDWRLLIFSRNQSFTGQGSPDPTDNLIAFQGSKSRSMNNPVGSYKFTLTAVSSGGYRWKELPLMSFVVFQIRPHTYEKAHYGAEYRTRFMGYVTQVEEQWQMTAQSGQRVVILHCVDPMVAFQSQVYFPSSLVVAAPGNSSATVESIFQKLMAVQKLTEGTQAVGTSFIGALIDLFSNDPIGAATMYDMSPSAALWGLLRWTMSAFFNPMTQVQFPWANGTAAWNDWIYAYLSPSANYKYSLLYPMTQASWWENMTPWFNAPFFECFGDVRSADELDDLMIADPGVQIPLTDPVSLSASASFQNDVTYNGTVGVQGAKPGHGFTVDKTGGRFAFVYRNKPFSPANWDKLTMTTVGDTITDFDYSRSTDQVVNLTQVLESYYMQTLGANNVMQQVFMPMVWDENSILQYGVQQPLQAQVGAMSLTTFTNPNGQQVEMTPYMLQLGLVAWAWYHQNPNLWNGSATIAGNPHIRIGQRIHFSEGNMEAYVEQIDESASIAWGNVQPYQQHITFSRGMYGPEKARIAEDWEAMVLALPGDVQALIQSENINTSSGGTSSSANTPGHPEIPLP